jgi:predicted small integral membrane protein
VEAILFLVDAALVAGLALWMTVAVADNWRHPRMNEEAVAMVVRLDLLAVQYPEDYAHVAHRRIDDPAIIRRLFHTIRLAETVAAAALFLSALLLVLAAGGAVPGEVATGAGLLSAAFFTLIWGGFVIGGNYFAYWYCHQWAQSNHFMLMYWGFFVLIVLLL